MTYKVDYEKISKILYNYTRSWEVITIKDPKDSSKTIDVVPPYVMNVSKDEKENDYIKPKQRTGPFWKEYINTLTRLQNELPNPGNVDPSGSSIGKARPEVLKAFLEEKGKSLLENKHNGTTFKNLREGLKYYGFGIDCSGFVSRAIGQVMYELNTPLNLRFDTLWYYHTDSIKKYDPKHNYPYRSNCSKLETVGSEDVNPENIKPGDILYNRHNKNFHIRIVLETLQNDGNEYHFITAESSSPQSKLRVLRKRWKYLKKENRLFYAFLDNNGEIEFPATIVNAKFRKTCDNRPKDNIICTIPKGSKININYNEKKASNHPENSTWYEAVFDNKKGFICDITFSKDGFIEETDWNNSDVTFKFKRPKAFIDSNEATADSNIPTETPTTNCPKSTPKNNQAEEPKNTSDFQPKANAITTSKANLRAKPTTDSESLVPDLIPKGAPIYVDFSKKTISNKPKPNSTWYAATYNNIEGYLCDITFKKLK